MRRPQNRELENPPDPAPAREPRPCAYLPVHAELLRRVADDRGLAAAAVRQLKPCAPPRPIPRAVQSLRPSVPTLFLRRSIPTPPPTAPRFVKEQPSGKARPSTPTDYSGIPSRHRLAKTHVSLSAYLSCIDPAQSMQYRYRVSPVLPALHPPKAETVANNAYPPTSRYYPHARS